MSARGKVDGKGFRRMGVGLGTRLTLACIGILLTACAYYPDEVGGPSYYASGYYYAGHHHYPRDYYYGGKHHRYGYSHNHHGHGEHHHRHAGPDNHERDGDRGLRKRRYGEKDHHFKKGKDRRGRREERYTGAPTAPIAPSQADSASSNKWRTINTPTGVVRIPAVIPNSRLAVSVQPRSRGEVGGRTAKAQRQAVKTERRAVKAQKRASKAQRRAYKAQYKAAKTNKNSSSAYKPAVKSVE